MTTSSSQKQLATMCLVAITFGVIGFIIGVMDREQGMIIGGSILIGGGLVALGMSGKE